MGKASAAYSCDNAGVALYIADGPRSRERYAADHAHRDCGRDSCHCRRQAWIASGLVASAFGCFGEYPAAADWVVGDGEAHRTGCRVPFANGACYRYRAIGVRWNWRWRCRATNLGPVASNEMWAEIYDPPGRADSHPSHHAGLCEHTPLVGARDACAGRTLGRKHGAAASWQPGARPAVERGSASQER